MRQKIGYRHLEERITGDCNLSEERKNAWKQFEDIREALYEKYLELIKSNSKFSDSSIESAIREITCRESNRSVADAVEQWRETIEKYGSSERIKPLKAALLSALSEFLNQE